MELNEVRSHFDLEEVDPSVVFEHIDGHVDHLFGPPDIECGKNECILLVRVKNGGPYLDEFMAHYQERLKVRHIFFLDNGSVDNTISRLKSYHDISVFQSALPFKIYQHAFTQYLVLKFGRNRWSLSADIDEFFDYPFSDVFPLNGFMEYLNANDYDVVVTQMLDLFSDHDLNKVQLSGKDFRRIQKYYDISVLSKEDYLAPKWKYAMTNEASNPAIKFFSGGIRDLVFDLSKVWLTKHPLMYFREPMTFPHCHLVLNAKAADVSCIFYHYKFLGHFLDYVKDAVEKEYHDNNSSEYKQYLKKLHKEKELRLVQPTSRVLDGQDELLKAEFIVVSDKYLEWIHHYLVSRSDGNSSPNGRIRALSGFAGHMANAFNKERTEDAQKPLVTDNKELQDLRKKVRKLEREIEEMRSSPTWRMVNMITKAFRRKPEK